MKLNLIIQMSIGQRLNELLKDKKMSQKELADLLNLDPSSITQFKQDKNKPSFATTKAICSIFDVSVEWFLYGLGQKFSNTPSDNKLSGKLDINNSSFNSNTNTLRNSPAGSDIFQKLYEQEKEENRRLREEITQLRIDLALLKRQLT